MVKKVLIHSRQTIEVWYGLPNFQRFADGNTWLPECAGLLTAKWIPRSGSGSPMSLKMATKAPLWSPTANIRKVRASDRIGGTFSKSLL